MTKTVEFIFDIAAPNGYLAWYPLKQVVARTGAQLMVTPVFLGGMHKLTGNAPPMIRDAEVKGKVAYAALEFQRFIDRHGLTRFKMHPALPFNSILLQRVLVAAADETQRQALVEALLPAVWERNVDCGDPQAVGQELAAAGFDAQALGDGRGDETVGGGDDHQGVTLLPVAVQQRICSGLHHGAHFFLHKGFPPRQ